MSKKLLRMVKSIKKSIETESLEDSSEQKILPKDEFKKDKNTISSTNNLNPANEIKINIPDNNDEINQTLQNAVTKKNQTHIPYFTFLISVAQIIIYLKVNCVYVTLFCYSPKYRSQLWRLVTYSFLHATPCHLILNQANLILFGFTFEMEHGFPKALIIYMTGAIAGALGFDFFDRTQRMIGASGSCSAYLMAHLSYLLLNWEEIKYTKYRKAVIISFAISDITSGPISRILKLEENFSWTSHMSAGVNGFFLGFLILNSKNRKISVKLKCFITALYVMVSELLIIQYVPFIMDALYMHSKRCSYC